MIRLLTLILLLSTGLLTSMARAADAGDSDLDELRTKLSSEWLLVKYDRLRNIKTYARVEDGKRYRSFKVEAVLNSRMEPLARVLLDFEGYTRWFWKTREARLVRKDSPTDYYVYMVHDAPYGLPDRDTVINAKVSPQSKTQPFIELRTKVVPALLPVKPPLVRMLAEDIMIRFTPMPNHQVQMVAEGYFDPGGVVPPWAANLVQRSAPYSVMLALQRTTESPEYTSSKSPLPFPVYDAEALP